jgi:hypothetical protein
MGAILQILTAITADFPETSEVCEPVLREAGEKAVLSRPAIDMFPKEFWEPVPWEA